MKPSETESHNLRQNRS